MSKKVQYSLEFPLRSSASLLYEFVSTPNGLQEWFADEVNKEGHDYIFGWNGSVEKAVVIDQRENEYIRFRWENMEKDEYFEFKIVRSDITNDTELVITDFANKTDLKDQQDLWESQVHELKHRLGS